MVLLKKIKHKNRAGSVVIMVYTNTEQNKIVLPPGNRH